MRKNDSLRYLIKLAYETTPLWREKFNKAGLKPEDIRTREDLLKAMKKGIYLTPKDLYDPRILPSYITEGKVFRKFYMSSGTTGMPKIIPKTPDDMKRLGKQGKEAYFPLSLSKDDRILNLLPSSPAISGPASSDIFNMLDYKVSLFHVGPSLLSNPPLMEKIVDLYSPTVIFGLPTTLYRLPEIIEKEIKARALLSGGEPTSFEKLRKIVEKYNAKLIVNVYASVEDTITAYITCSKTDIDNLYKLVKTSLVELVDENFERVSEREYGKISITSLYPKNSLPGIIFLNYLIGDEALKIDEKHIAGIRRCDETVSIAGAKENPQTIEKILFKLMKKYPALTGEYVVIWEELPDGKQGLEIRIESTKNYEEICEEIKNEIFSINYPYWEQVKLGNAFLEIKIVEPSHLYPETYKPKPGKPKRLLIKGIDFI